MAYVQSGLRRVTDLETENMLLRIRNHSAFDSLVLGKATRYDLDALVAVSNMAMALSRKYGEDWKEELVTAANAIEGIQKRMKRWGKIQATDAEATAIDTLLKVHDLQLDASDVADLEKAIIIARKGVNGLKETA